MKPRTPNPNPSHKQTNLRKNQLSKTTITQFPPNPVRHNKCSEDVHLMTKSTKVSIQKSQEIGQNQYKQAMKHVLKVDSLQKKQNENKKQKMQELTVQHTFKPKINQSSKLNYLYESITHSLQKIHIRNHSKERDPKEKFYDRLMKWGKNHDDRVRDNYLRGKVEKESVEKSFQSTGTNSKEKGQNLDQTRSSLQKMEQKFLNSLRSSNQTKRQQVKTYVNGEQSYYQRQAKAVAMKNGETFYYSTNPHSHA